MASTETGVPQSEQALSVWRYRNFLVVFITAMIIGVGNKIYALALPLILYDLTQSSVVMGTMRAIEYLPNLLLALFIGVIADRVNKKRLMLSAILIQVVLLAGLYAMLYTGTIYIWIFYLVGFVLMTCNYSYENAKTTIVKHVVPNTLLTSANAKFALITTLVSVMGPAFSGFILMLSDLKSGLLITSIALLMGWIASSQLEGLEPDAVTGKTTFWQDFKEGWQQLRNNRLLWSLTLIVACTSAAEGMYSSMIVYFGKETMELESSTLGLVLCSSGLGGLVASLVVDKWRKMYRTGHLMGTMMLLVSLSFLLMCFATNVWIMALSLFLEGLFSTVYVICILAFRQESTPAHLIGRVAGLTGSMFKLALPFAIYSAGYVTEWFGATYVFLGSALLNFLLFVLFTRLPLWKMP
ncbi:MFS transporter [Brevibacillus humidisoli]|uniref:MFS transporter n=1 Tax=Brevibacillus humidisoli TaxID=2895522 RepID=UPI001E2EB55E|nr:MFS transporter [Brevibacillus humidisoli]UFJ42356.1 MFS transporter [Brevibacillus humidisoli]